MSDNHKSIEVVGNVNGVDIVGLAERRLPALMSEAALSKYWNTPEEDEAWKGLLLLPRLPEHDSGDCDCEECRAGRC